MNLKIKRHSIISQTPAVAFAMRAYADLMDRGHTENYPNLNWNDSAITAWLEEGIVGVIVWTKVDFSKTIQLKLGYIHPAFRKRGIYSKLWDELVKIATNESVWAIEGGTHPDNADMRAIAKKQGRVEYGILYRYVIKPQAQNAA